MILDFNILAQEKSLAELHLLGSCFWSLTTMWRRRTLILIEIDLLTYYFFLALFYVKQGHI